MKIPASDLINLGNRLTIDGLESVRDIFFLLIEITAPYDIQPCKPDDHIHYVSHRNTYNTQNLGHYAHSINHSCVL
jgi:hypothetical protein